MKHPSPASDPIGLSVEHEPDRGIGGAAFRCLFRAPDDPGPGPLSRAELLALLNQLPPWTAPTSGSTCSTGAVRSSTA